MGSVVSKAGKGIIDTGKSFINGSLGGNVETPTTPSATTGGSTVSGPHDAGEGAGGSWQGGSWVPGPYVSDPGVQPGQSQPQVEGMDYSKRGPAEQQWIDQKATYNTPSFGETNTQNLVAGAQQPTQTNNSQQWFDSVTGRMPVISTEPGFGAYFDNAKNRAAESINRSTAATGTYGSSSANDQTSRAFTDLEGQRALKEADYNLQRLGEQRAWEGLGGSLAGQADQQSLANSNDDQNWMGLLSKLGIDSSRLGLDRTNAGFDAAGLAQGAERTRGQDFFNNEAAAGDRLADVIKAIMGPALDNEAELWSLENSGGVASANTRAAQEAQNAQNTIDYAKTGLGAYEYLK